MEKRQKTSRTSSTSKQSDEKTFDHYGKKIGEGKKMLQGILDANPNAGLEESICGLLASAEKREAQTYAASTDPKHADNSFKALQRSHLYYVQFSHANPVSSWAIHQVLSLSLALGRKNDRHGELWLQAIGPALATLERSHSQEDAIWARTDLIELFLLACDTRKWTGGQLVDGCVRNLPRVNLANKTNEAWDFVSLHVGEVARRKSIAPFAVAATSRQLLRYAEWLTTLKGSLLGDIDEPAKKLFKLLDA